MLLVKLPLLIVNVLTALILILDVLSAKQYLIMKKYTSNALSASKGMLLIVMD